MLLSVVMQGQTLSFLVDSGSSLCFLDQSKAHLFEGKQPLHKLLRVQVAGVKFCIPLIIFLNWSRQLLAMSLLIHSGYCHCRVMMVSLAMIGL
jgi:hypothetical protein